MSDGICKTKSKEKLVSNSVQSQLQKVDLTSAKNNRPAQNIQPVVEG